MNESHFEKSKLMPNRLVFTENAARKVYELMVKEDNKNLKLRLFLVGGGCAGFQYGFSFDETVNPGDVMIKKSIKTVDQNADEQLVSLLIDPISFLYLSEAEVDYIDSAGYSQFVVHNPNVRTTCGCGKSFSAEEIVDNED